MRYAPDVMDNYIKNNVFPNKNQISLTNKYKSYFLYWICQLSYCCNQLMVSFFNSLLSLVEFKYIMSVFFKDKNTSCKTHGWYTEATWKDSLPFSNESQQYVYFITIPFLVIDILKENYIFIRIHSVFKLIYLCNSDYKYMIYI